MAFLPTPAPFIFLPAVPATVYVEGLDSWIRMPRMLYGTAWKKERTKDLCILALEKGFRGFDTACQPKHYNQKGVGEAIQHALSNMGLERKDLYIQTKFTPAAAQDPATIPYDPRLSLRRQVRESILVRVARRHLILRKYKTAYRCEIIRSIKYV